MIGKWYRLSYILDQTSFQWSKNTWDMEHLVEINNMIYMWTRSLNHVEFHGDVSCSGSEQLPELKYGIQLDPVGVFNPTSLAKLWYFTNLDFSEGDFPY